MGRVLTQKSVKDGKSVLDASYSYDANDNVIKEIIDGQTNDMTSGNGYNGEVLGQTVLIYLRARYL